MDSVKDYLIERKKIIDNHIKSMFERIHINDIDKMGEVIKYALFSGGKRIRPILAIAIYEVKRKDVERILAAACCVELLHTASLMLDDLPSMDNAKLRRGKPSPYVIFGESTTILSAISLAAKAFEILSAELEKLKVRRNVAITLIEMTAKLVGMEGATGGQFLDLYKKKISKDDVIDIYIKKTSSLFYLSALLGSELAGYTYDERSSALTFAKHFGLLFQLVDDIRDINEDKRINIVKICGLHRAIEMMEEEKNNCLRELNYIEGDTTKLKELTEYIFEEGRKCCLKISKK